MSGDDHDFMTGYDGITAYVETSTEAKYLDPLDLEVTVTEKDGKRRSSGSRPSASSTPRR